MNTLKTSRSKLKAKRAFIKKGTCSRTFFYLLNREFGHPMDNEEQAIDQLAGGIMQQGYQCGMLWGSSMAIGAESFRRNDNLALAIDKSLTATQHTMKSFAKRTGTIECEEITNCDFNNKKSFLKYMLTGKFVGCFKLAGKWAPEAINAAEAGLSFDPLDLGTQAQSCASEVVKQMGGTENEMAMVAGFAGGLGLSGNGCGALAAAVWMNALMRNRKEEVKYTMKDPDAEKILNAFFEETDYKMECNSITGKSFKSINEHSEFIQGGGCQKLITVLAKNAVE